VGKTRPAGPPPPGELPHRFRFDSENCQFLRPRLSERASVEAIKDSSVIKSDSHRNGKKSYGFGFFSSADAFAEVTIGLGFQKEGSALIHSSCT
jgi:hypothetical protein